MKRFFSELFRPRQILILNDDAGMRTRRLFIRPVTMVLIILAAMLLGGLAGHLIASRQESGSLLPQYLQMQRLLKDAQSRLAEAEAALALKNEQVANLKGEMEKHRQATGLLRQRMRMYESILEARKSGGVQILKADAAWQNKETISYDILLVKGGSRPRRVSGRLRLLVRDEGEHEEILKLGKYAPELPYRMESHTFLHGTYQWKQDWRPSILVIIRLNRKGEASGQMDVPIQGVKHENRKNEHAGQQ